MGLLDSGLKLERELLSMRVDRNRGLPLKAALRL
jgi:hypothetical protein